MKVIFQPIKPFFITQGFGENKACVSLDGTRKVIRCDGKNPPAGYKSLYGSDGHTGIDLRASHGQEVYAAQDGIVYQIDTKIRSGLDVRIEHEVNGRKYRTIYEHLMGYQVQVGDTVRVGQCIGWADNTGYSSGDHLHFVLEEYRDGAWVRIDPMAHMEPIFALDFLKLLDRFAYLKEMVAKWLDEKANSLRKNT